MRSQQTVRPLNPASRRVWVLLFVLAWGLGQALALGHRLGHAPHAPPGTAHLHDHDHVALVSAAAQVGGEHHDGEPVCRLVDQLGLGEALVQAALPPVLAPVRAASLPTPGLPAAGPARRRPYEARAPPLG